MMNRVAIITGGGSGIGAEVAKLLQRADKIVYILDRAHSLSATNFPSDRPTGRLIYQCCDVTDFFATQSIIKKIIDAEGCVDILVNNVGGNTENIPVENISLKQWENTFDVNVKSTFICTQLVVPAMKNQRWGRIVNVSSIAGRTKTLFSNSAYSAAKTAVIGFTKQCAYELAPYGICVNSVAHGFIETPRIARAWQNRSAAERENILNAIPTHRLGTIQEAAAAVYYFCAEEAGYTIGAVLDVNGGLFL
jgi:3-oxoacyl-[acyl-carrier protein] reductase